MLRSTIRIAVGGALAAAAAGGAAVAVMLRPGAMPFAYAVPVAAGLAAGVACVVVLLWMMRMIGGERRRLRQRLHELKDDRAARADDPFTSRFHLDELWHEAAHAVQGYREQLGRVNAQRRALEVENRLNQAERRRLETVLNALSDAVIVTDAFDELALANGMATRLLGLEPGGEARSLQQAISDPGLVRLIRETRNGGDPSLRRHVEHRLRAPGDETSSTYEVTLACVAPPASSSTGDAGYRSPTAAPPPPAGVVTILRDVTREREVADMKNQFVSHVSHEMRTPLSSIKAYIEMLADGEVEDEPTKHRFYETIQSEADRLSRLIDNILNISRIESGVVQARREPLSLQQIVGEAMSLLRPQAQAKGVELTEAPCPVTYQVFADRDMVLQAVLNLVSNAIKYTPKGGKIGVELGVDEHAQRVTVAVTDTGVGIPEEDLPRLFEKFFRVAGHERMAKGTGLGLSLAKQIVERVHAGRLTVTSEVGKGSTFTMALPMTEEQGETRGSDTGPAGDRAGRASRVG